MHENYNIYLNSSGWPFLSMRYTALNHAVLGPPGAGLHQTDGLNLPTRWRRTGEMNILPVAPVAAGFVADTAIYGAIALLLWTGPALLLRVVRQRRVRCAACGYDRRGLAADAKCPECGVTPARG